jgi:hypothetical protein
MPATTTAGIILRSLGATPHPMPTAEMPKAIPTIIPIMAIPNSVRGTHHTFPATTATMMEHNTAPANPVGTNTIQRTVVLIDVLVGRSEEVIALLTHTMPELLVVWPRLVDYGAN